MAFTTWLDFDQALQQAETILQAFVLKRPQHSGEFEENFTELKRDLGLLDEEMLALPMQDPARKLLVSPPVYQYLARRYPLNVASVMWEPSLHPDDRQSQSFDGLLRQHTAGWMLWEA